MWFPCDCAEELQRKSVVYGEGEKGWRGQGGCSCNGHGGSSAFKGSEGCSCFGGREGFKGLGGRGGSSGFGKKGGGKGHGRGSRMGGRGGSSNIEGKDGVQGRKGKNSIGGKGGDEGGRNNGTESDIGEEGGDGGTSGGGGSAAVVGKSGLLQDIHSLWVKLYDYCGPVGLWNLALATLLLGYYGKSYYWDSMGGRGSSKGGGRQIGGKIKCAPKPQSPCCCTCAERPRILKHRLKWPEEDGPCRCRI